VHCGFSLIRQSELDRENIMQHQFGAAIAAILLATPAWSQPSQLITKDAALAPSVTVLGSKQAEGILGKEVRSTADEPMGRIVDVIVDRTGRARAVIIDFGGFLGVGNRKIAVDWNALNFAAEGDKRDFIILALTREQVKSAPEYKDRRAVVVLGSAGLTSSTPNE
jgi:PRC-barrel domain